MTAGGEQPVPLVALTPTGVALAGRPSRQIDTGKTAWLDAGETVSFNTAMTPAEVLRFDFKTRPMESQ